jgi:hypothetical protein
VLNGDGASVGAATDVRLKTGFLLIVAAFVGLTFWTVALVTFDEVPFLIEF